MLRKFGPKALRIPGPVYFLWTVVIPAVPSLVAGAVAFLANASWGLIALIIFGGYVLAFGASVLWVPKWYASRRTNPEEQRAQDAALQTYLDQMEHWVLDRSDPLATSSPRGPRRALARERTLRVLEGLGPKHKRSVLRFLHALELIGNDAPVIPLEGADFSGAHLVDMRPMGSNLVGVNLSNADLTDAWLNDFSPRAGDIVRALKDNVYPGAFEEPIYTSNLVRANLMGAVLKRTMLAGCDLQSADLTDARACLTDRDVRG